MVSLTLTAVAPSPAMTATACSTAPPAMLKCQDVRVYLPAAGSSMRAVPAASVLAKNGVSTTLM